MVIKKMSTIPYFISLYPKLSEINFGKVGMFLVNIIDFIKNNKRV